MAFDHPSATAEAKKLICNAIPRCNGICDLSVFGCFDFSYVQEWEIKKVAKFEEDPEKMRCEDGWWEEAVKTIHECREWAHKSSKCANLPATPTPLAAPAAPLPKKK
jgi:hypothetical protein